MNPKELYKRAMENRTKIINDELGRSLSLIESGIEDAVRRGKTIEKFTLSEYEQNNIYVIEYLKNLKFAVTRSSKFRNLLDGTYGFIEVEWK